MRNVLMRDCESGIQLSDHQVLRRLHSPAKEVNVFQHVFQLLCLLVKAESKKCHAFDLTLPVLPVSVRKAGMIATFH